jgi:hypothetical protein
MSTTRARLNPARTRICTVALDALRTILNCDRICDFCGCQRE